MGATVPSLQAAPILLLCVAVRGWLNWQPPLKGVGASACALACGKHRQHAHGPWAWGRGVAAHPACPRAKGRHGRPVGVQAVCHLCTPPPKRIFHLCTPACPLCTPLHATCTPAGRACHCMPGHATPLMWGCAGVLLLLQTKSHKCPIAAPAASTCCLRQS